MIKPEATLTTSQVPVTVMRDEVVVILRLPQAHAVTLIHLMDHVGGDKEARKQTREVGDALRTAIPFDTRSKIPDPFETSIYVK